MDLHKDLESFRLAQSVLRKDEVTDRVLDVVNSDARRVDDYLSALNAAQRGMRTPTQIRHQFYLGDERLQSTLVPMVYNNREETLMASNSGDILDMYEWHKGAGNTDLHSYIVAHNDFAKQYAQQFARAPEIPPYAAELDIDRFGRANNDFQPGTTPGGDLPTDKGPKGALPPADSDVGGDGGAKGPLPPSDGAGPGGALSDEAKKAAAQKKGQEALKAFRDRNIPEYNRRLKALKDFYAGKKDKKAERDAEIEKLNNTFDEAAQLAGQKAYDAYLREAAPSNAAANQAARGPLAPVDAVGPRAGDAAAAAGFVDRGQEMRNEALAGEGEAAAGDAAMANAQLAQRDPGGLGGAAAELRQGQEAQANSQVLGNVNLGMQAAALAGERGVAPNPEIRAPPAENDIDGLIGRLQRAAADLEALGGAVPDDVRIQIADLQNQGGNLPEGPVLRYDARGAPRMLEARVRQQENAMVDAGRLENAERGDAEFARNMNPPSAMEQLYATRRDPLLPGLIRGPPPRRGVMDVQNANFRDFRRRRVAGDAAALAREEAAARLEEAVKAAAERQLVLRDAALQRIGPGHLDVRPGEPRVMPIASAPDAPADVAPDLQERLAAQAAQLQGLGVAIPEDMQRQLDELGVGAGAGQGAAGQGARRGDAGPRQPAGRRPPDDPVGRMQRINELQDEAAQYYARGEQVPADIQRQIDYILMRMPGAALEGRGHAPSKGVKRTLAPHQVKGSAAAKKHMAELRAKRAKK
jgi:hypothetical protein